jgi:peptidoglycan hydrolase FlgJ
MNNIDIRSASFQKLSQAAHSRAEFKGVGERQAQAGNEELRSAAQDFEALFVRQLLATMRRSVPEGNSDMKGTGSEIYESMLDAEFANHIAKSGRGLGLADMLMRQFEKTGGAQGDRFEND